MRSGTSSSGTTVAFLDDTSEEHKRFLTSSYNELLLSTKKNLPKKKDAKEYNNFQKSEIQEAAALPQKNVFIPRIPPPISQPVLLCPVPKFRNGSGNQQRLQLPSPVIESVEPCVENEAPVLASPTLSCKSEIVDLTSEYNDAATLRIRDTISQKTINRLSIQK